MQCGPARNVNESAPRAAIRLNRFEAPIAVAAKRSEQHYVGKVPCVVQSESLIARKPKGGAFEVTIVDDG